MLSHLPPPTFSVSGLPGFSSFALWFQSLLQVAAKIGITFVFVIDCLVEHFFFFLPFETGRCSVSCCAESIARRLFFNLSMFCLYLIAGSMFCWPEAEAVLRFRSLLALAVSPPDLDWSVLRLSVPLLFYLVNCATWLAFFSRSPLSFNSTLRGS